MIELCIMVVAVLLTMLGYAVLCWIGGNQDD
jgi:hypothetical protein